VCVCVKFLRCSACAHVHIAQVIAFAVGTYTSLEALLSFSVYASIGVLMVFIFQVRAWGCSAQFACGVLSLAQATALCASMDLCALAACFPVPTA
jgi:hypothetical protein